MNRLVDYPAYQKHYGPRDVPDPLIPGRVFEGVRRNVTMGTFRQELLTPLGKLVLAESRKFYGRLPKHRGACKVGVYLKWEVRSWDEYHALMVFRDWLLDQGIDVTVTESERKPKMKRTPYGWNKAVPEPEGGNRYLKFDLR